MVDNQITFTVEKSSDSESVGITKTFAVNLEGGKVIFTQRDSSDELFKEDNGSAASSEKAGDVLIVISRKRTGKTLAVVVPSKTWVKLIGKYGLF